MSINFAIINVFLSIVGATFIAWELAAYHKYLTIPELIGKAGMGAMLVLTIAPIIANNGSPYFTSYGTPFNLWPSTGLRLSIITLIAGRIRRHRKHDRANALTIEAATEHFRNVHRHAKLKAQQKGN